MGFFENIRDRAHKAAAYQRTVAELNAMSRDVKLDLGIYDGDIADIARKSVYGR